MREDEAAKIVQDFLNSDELLPCYIVSLRLDRGEARDRRERSEWVAIIAYDVPEEHIAHGCNPIVLVDDETGAVRVIESL